MPRYANQGGNSGVVSYEISPTSITVRFSDGSEYRYTEGSAGSANIRAMHGLARSGRGLNAFINTRAKYRYAARHR